MEDAPAERPWDKRASPSATHSAARARSAEPPSRLILHFPSGCCFRVRLPSQRSLNMKPIQASTSWNFSRLPRSPPVRAHLAPAGWHIAHVTKGKGFSLGPGGWEGRGGRARVAGDAHLLWAAWRGRAEPGIFPNSLPAAPRLREAASLILGSQQNGQPCLFTTKDKLQPDTAPAPEGHPRAST